MKKLILIINIGLSLLLAGCYNGIAIQTDADKTVRLRDYSTYSLQSNFLEEPSNPLYENELNERRIKEALQKHLGKRNYNMVENQPDFFILYSFQVESKIRQDYTNSRYDYYFYYPYAFRDVYEVEEYEVGELVLEFKEGKSNQTIWVGAAMDILAKGTSGIEERLDDAVSQLISAFHKDMVSNGSKVAYK